MERRWIAVALLSVLSGCNYYDSPHGWCPDDGRDDRPRLDDAGAPRPDEEPCGGGCGDDAVCVEGACAPLDDVCRHAVDCGPGRACVDNACRPACAGDEDCAHGTACDRGLCLPDARCEDATDCDAGEACVERRCLAGCADDAACGPDGRCVEGHCRPDVAPRPFCVTDADCAPGHLCVSGVCRTPCPSGEDDECRRWDAQLVQCEAPEPGLHLCYTRAESNPECVTRADCEPSRHCIDGLCR